MLSQLKICSMKVTIASISICIIIIREYDLLSAWYAPETVLNALYLLFYTREWLPLKTNTIIPLLKLMKLRNSSKIYTAS